MADALMAKLVELGLDEQGVTSPHQRLIETLNQTPGGFMSEDEPLDPLRAETAPTPEPNETTTSENLHAVCSKIKATAAQGSVEEALQLAQHWEALFKHDWIDTLPPHMHGLSCGNDLEQALSARILGNKTYLCLPYGLERLYLLMAGLCMSLNRYDEALIHLDTAAELNPASFDVWRMYEYCATLDDDDRGAADYLDQAYRVATSAEDLAHIYRRWASHAAKCGNIDTAYLCLTFSIMLDRSSKNVSKCLAELVGLGRCESRCRYDIDPTTVKRKLAERGYPIGLSSTVTACVVKHMRGTESKALPSPSFVAAYMAARILHEEDVSDMRDLAMLVTPFSIDNVSIIDYLFRPILLLDEGALNNVGCLFSQMAPSDASGSYVGRKLKDQRCTAATGSVLDRFIKRHRKSGAEGSGAQAGASRVAEGSGENAQSSELGAGTNARPGACAKGPLNMSLPLGAANDVGLIAIPYIDEHRGLSFEVLGLCSATRRQLIKEVPKNTRVSLGSEGLDHARIMMLRAQDFPDLGIEERAMELAISYAPDIERDKTRRLRAVDALRSFESPDDILVVLTNGRGYAEGVWMTMEGMCDGQLYAKLTTEPFADFGIHTGDVRPLRMLAPSTGAPALAFLVQ